MTDQSNVNSEKNYYSAEELQEFKEIILQK